MKRSQGKKELLLTLMIGVGMLLGALVEITVWFLDLYRFQSWWMALFVILALFGIGLGNLTFFLRFRPLLAAFLASAIAFAAEIANAQWLALWVFDERILALLPNMLVRAAVYGLPVFFAPLIVRALATRLHGAMTQPRGKAEQGR